MAPYGSKEIGLLPVVLTSERNFSMVTSLFRLVKMLKITRQQFENTSLNNKNKE